MSTEAESMPPQQRASSEHEAAASPGEEDPRYASQAAAAEPAPVAFEGAAAAPGGAGGTTGRREWAFLMLAVFFSLVLVAIPAVFFTGIDLTAATDDDGGGSAPEGSEEAREIERLQLLQETRADALAKLYTYGPAGDTGTFRIPVEQAMRLTLREQYASSGGTGARWSSSRSWKEAVPGGASGAGSLASSDSTALP